MDDGPRQEFNLDPDNLDLAAAGQRLALSPAQRLIVKGQRNFPKSPQYNVGGGALIDGWIDINLFTQALQCVTDEFEALRLVISNDGSQILLDHHRPVMLQVDVSDAPDPDRNAQEWMKADFVKPLAFDGENPPWYVALIAAGKDRYWLHIHFHHAMMDGYGSAVFTERWAEHYNALSEGRLPKNPIDSTIWQRHVQDTQEYDASAQSQQALEFWQEHLTPLPPQVFEASIGEPMPVEHETLSVSRARYESWNTAGLALKGSAFHILLASVALYFAQTKGQDRVVIGVPVLNRVGRQQRSIPGMFAQVLPISIDVAKNTTSTELIADVVRNLRQASRHQKFPQDTLHHALDLARQGRTAVFDVVLSFMRQKYEISFGTSPLLQSLQHFSNVSRFPIGLTICEFDSSDDISFISEYYPGVTGRSDAARISNRFLDIADALIEPDQPLSDIPMMTRQEWSDTVVAQYAQDRHSTDAETVLSSFLFHAGKTPDQIAVRQGQRQITYGALARRASSIANVIQKSPTPAPNIVGLACERSPDYVAALLGCLMSKAAFLPLDIDLPDARLLAILDVVTPGLVLADGDQTARLQTTATTLNLDEIKEEAETSNTPPDLDSIAYVLMTSGSSGTPKAVMVSHRALSLRIAGYNEHWRIGTEDTSFQAMQLTFDPAIADLFMPLASGGTIGLSSPGRISPSAMLADMKAMSVTFLISTPSLLDKLVSQLEKEDMYLSLKLCISGGEVLTSKLMRRLCARLSPNLHNVYGPTEAIIGATYWKADPDVDGVLPIGWPMRDTSVLVMSDSGVPLPPFEAGEIWIGGGALAIGYLGKPDLSAEKFCPDPVALKLHRDTEARVYKTGDRGWMDETGLSHFAGRHDRQIKLRGFRIEPEDIETAAATCIGVASAAVTLIAATTYKADPKLHLFAEPSPQATLCPSQLSNQLRAQLPNYMWPSGITIVDPMPRTATGKIDFKALVPDNNYNGPTAIMAKVQPVSALASEVQRIWSNVLRAPVVEADDFFLQGGDSLSAVEMLLAVSVLIGHDVSFSTLLSAPTLQKFTAALESNFGTTTVQLVLGVGTGKISLHIAASGYGDAVRMHALAQTLPGVTVTLLQPPNLKNFDVELGIPELAELYADAIEAERGEAVFIAGFSIGGVVALETASILQSRGRAVNGIVLIDTSHPGGHRGMLVIWKALRTLTSSLGLGRIRLNGRKLHEMFADPALDLQVRAASMHKLTPVFQPVDFLQGARIGILDIAFMVRWKRCLRGSVKIYRLPGFHGGMFKIRNRNSIANALRSIFDNRT